jgi:hypothetical protein
MELRLVAVEQVVIDNLLNVLPVSGSHLLFTAFQLLKVIQSQWSGGADYTGVSGSNSVFSTITSAGWWRRNIVTNRTGRAGGSGGGGSAGGHCKSRWIR